MMNFNWNSDTIRWYQEADQYTGFFKNIASLVIPKLAGYSRFCDIGCGLGIADLEFSKYVKSIACIDSSKEAIAALKKSVADGNFVNIEPRLMDCNAIDESWDVIYVSFFGGRNLPEFLPRCKKLIAVVGKKNQSELYPEKYRSFQKSTIDETEQLLRQKKITYSLSEASFEFGQPFKSMKDARNFVTSQAPRISPADLADFLSQRLVETGEKQYPYFMPRMKEIGIFEIKGEL